MRAFFRNSVLDAVTSSSSILRGARTRSVELHRAGRVWLLLFFDIAGCSSLAPFVRNERTNRWSAAVGNSWTSHGGVVHKFPDPLGLNPTRQWKPSMKRRECHSPSGKVARVGFVRPTPPASHPTELDVQVARVEGKVCRCGSGARCTSEGGDGFQKW